MKACPFSNLKFSDKSVKQDIVKRDAAYQRLIRQNFGLHNDTRGLFGPESMHWKIYRCPAVILGAYSALLLQISHPAVADGVARFSQFSTDYLGRAERTFTSMIKIYFGDLNTALASGKKLHYIHNRIRGKIKIKAHGIEVMQAYCACEPMHLTWVQATLVHTSIQLYESVNTRLTVTEKEQFYQESKKTALIMGIPLEEYPKNHHAFKIYYESMVQGSYLRVDKTTRALAKTIFKPPYVPAWIAKLFAAGFLPFHLRTSFDLRFTKRMRWVFSSIVGIVKVFTRIVPAPFGFTPPYYQAHYRIAIYTGLRPKRIIQFFNYLSSFRLFKAVRL